LDGLVNSSTATYRASDTNRSNIVDALNRLEKRNHLQPHEASIGGNDCLSGETGTVRYRRDDRIERNDTPSSCRPKSLSSRPESTARRHGARFRIRSVRELTKLGAGISPFLRFISIDEPTIRTEHRGLLTPAVFE
jgi:hypothetical protein